MRDTKRHDKIMVVTFLVGGLGTTGGTYLLASAGIDGNVYMISRGLIACGLWYLYRSADRTD